MVFATSYRSTDMPQVPVQKRMRSAQRALQLQTAGLIVGLSGLLMLTGYLLAGGLGLLIAVGGLVGLALSGAAPATGVRIDLPRLNPWQAPTIHGMVAELSRRAGLPARPEIYLSRIGIPNAAAVGVARPNAIIVTSGLLQSMPDREIAGVLAHEISHLRNEDHRFFAVADRIRFTLGLYSRIAFGLVLLQLPLVLVGVTVFSPLALLFLSIAPLIGMAGEFAMRRIREYAADLGAAELTNDPEGLARALQRLSNPSPDLFSALFGFRRPTRGEPEQGGLLRTHPPTDERIRRLLSLRQSNGVGGRRFPAASSTYHSRLPDRGRI